MSFSDSSSPLLLPLVGMSLLGNLLSFLGYSAYNLAQPATQEILHDDDIQEIHEEIVAPLEEFSDAYDYFSSAEVQDNLINEYDTADVLTAPVDDEVIETSISNSEFPPDIEARLKIFQEEYQLDDEELDMVVEMILAESRMMQLKQ